MSASPPWGSLCAPRGLSSLDDGTDTHWMQQALSEARRASGRTSPNPAVGAIIVRDGVVIGTGHTRPLGQAHAEVVALAQAGAQARGATLYVTLEPCAHYGRTPPCTVAIIAAGIGRVVAAVRDPFPRVDGRGIAQLRAAGIAVTVGTCADAAWEQIAGFVKHTRTGLPLVTAKYAMTLDGRIATRTGDARWITGEESRQIVHQLRDTHDAILVGAGTVRADDPLLTTRLPDEAAGAGGPHSPLRVIVTRHFALPPDTRVFDPALPGGTLVACSAITAADQAWLEARGIPVVILPTTTDSNGDLTVLLRLLAARGITTVLVEGGGGLLGALFDAGLVDRVIAFVAPVIVGGNEAPGPVGGTGAALLRDAWRLDAATITAYGADICISGYLPQARSWRALPHEPEGE